MGCAGKSGRFQMLYPGEAEMRGSADGWTQG